MCVSVLTVPVVGQSVSGTESWVAPRTVDGHPDLQGVWANNNATPLERPPEWADKERLTDEELAERTILHAAWPTVRERLLC